MESELESGLSRSAEGTASSSAPEIAAANVEDKAKADFYVLHETPKVHQQLAAPEQCESTLQMTLSECHVTSGVCESNASEEVADEVAASRTDGAVDNRAETDIFCEDESDEYDSQGPGGYHLKPETDRRQERDTERAQREKEQLEEFRRRRAPPTRRANRSSASRRRSPRARRRPPPLPALAAANHRRGPGSPPRPSAALAAGRLVRRRQGCPQ